MEKPVLHVRLNRHTQTHTPSSMHNEFVFPQIKASPIPPASSPDRCHLEQEHPICHPVRCMMQYMTSKSGQEQIEFYCRVLFHCRPKNFSMSSPILCHQQNSDESSGPSHHLPIQERMAKHWGLLNCKPWFASCGTRTSNMPSIELHDASTWHQRQQKIAFNNGLQTYLCASKCFAIDNIQTKQWTGSLPFHSLKFRPIWWMITLRHHCPWPHCIPTKQTGERKD